MYHNNGYSGDGGGGQFPGNMNNQNNFQSFAGSPTGQHSLLQQQQIGLAHYEEPDTYMALGNSFHPDLPLFNQQALAQNGFVTPVTQLSNPQPVSTPSTPSSTPMNLNTRAAELKAKLLRGRQGSTPPVTARASKMESSAVGSPRTPLAGGNNGDLVDDLIQQYAPPNGKNTRVQVEKTNGLSSTKTIEHPKHLKTTALGSPTLVTKPEGQNGTSLGKSLNNKLPSNDSMSEVSEGEIIEDTVTVPEKPVPTEPKKAQPQIQIQTQTQNQTPLKTNEKGSIVRRGPRDEEPTRSSHRTSQEEGVSATRPTSSSSRPQGPRIYEESRDDDLRVSRRRYSSDLNDRRTSIPENRTDSYSYSARRGSRDQNDVDRKTEVKKDPRREEIRTSSHQNKELEVRKPVAREAKPTLEQVLPHDPDLREWLDITGYHNREYRDKILIRRRKIAALDAQKAQLLLEMEIEERGGHPPTSGTSSLTAVMAPPPAPTKPPTPISKRPETNHSESDSDPERSQVISNKRAYSPSERGEAGGSKKFARTEEWRSDERRSSRPKIKEEEDEPHSSRSSGYDYFRNDRRDDREYDGRGRGNRGRSFSPPVRDGRARGFDDFDDATSSKKDSRPFEVVGGYRGRAFDPNFRGRGRGRGRGEGRGDFSSGRGGFRSDFRGDDFDSRDREEIYGSKLANSQPYKDRKVLQRGGKGETRYFIVKSFNEDNVLNCIEDGIWTTQKQNGEVFKAAFETCKDVIFVFSINKSRAFQGYARMESLPGSVTPPSWQKAINWESAGAFRVRWLVICTTLFRRIGHLKNALNENQAVLIGKDGQEIEENCGASLIELIDEEYKEADRTWHRTPWDDRAPRS